MTANFKYLVYDIESVTNKPLLNKVLYSGEGLTDEAAYQKHLAELLKDDRDFVNPAFHKPVSIAVMAVRDDFSISRIGILGEPENTVASRVKHFWDIYNKDQPILVDFNGKGFDVRLLELWAFQLGFPIHKRHFAKFGTRYKFNEENHLDLHDFMSNYGAIRYRGGLNLFSKLLGKPGKMDTKGDMVQTLFDQGDKFRIDDYCLSDVLDTYFVFLRTRVMMGEITLDREKELVRLARTAIEEKNKTDGYFKNYLQNFGEWIPENS